MNFTKKAVLWGISKGLRLPQIPIERINELGFLKRLLAQLEIDCVLDVGANRGQFASELRRIGYSGYIVSFEPVRSVFEQLQKAFEHDTKWKGYPLALGRSKGSKSIMVPELSVMSSFLESLSPNEKHTKEVVETRRLDELLATTMVELGVSRIFLKMDTQGYDLEVFCGASNCLDCIIGIQSELSIQPLYKGMPHYIEALQEYESKGFELFNLSVVNRISTGGLLELNCFMRRP